MEPGGLGRADETDRAIEAVVVRDGQPGQPQFDGPFDEVIRGRGAVEEREVGVAMEFGVRGRCHEVLRSGSRLTRGLASIEHMFYLTTPVPVATRTRFPSKSPKKTKQDGGGRRLTDMHAPMRQIAFSAVRVGAMVALAMGLILGLLPAVLAVQAGKHVTDYMTSRWPGGSRRSLALDCDGRVPTRR